MVSRRSARGDAEAGAGIALRVEVDDQHAPAGGGQGGGEIDRRRGLADAALLVGDGEDAGAGGRLAGAQARRISLISRTWPSGSLRLGSLVDLHCPVFARHGSIRSRHRRPLRNRQVVPACTCRCGQRQQLGQRRQGPRGDHVGRERRHRLAARRMHGHGRHRRRAPPRAGTPPCAGRSRSGGRSGAPRTARTSPGRPAPLPRSTRPRAPGGQKRQSWPLSRMWRRQGSARVAGADQVDRAPASARSRSR